METRAEIPPQLRAPTGAGKLSHTTLRQDPGAPHQESIASGVVVCSRESGKPGSARLLVDDCATTGLSGARKCHRHFLIPRCVICYAFTCNAHPGCSELTSLWGHRSGVAGHETEWWRLRTWGPCLEGAAPACCSQLLPSGNMSQCGLVPVCKDK